MTKEQYQKMERAIPCAEKLIQEAEGLMLTEYVCPAGKRTIGYGQRVDHLSDSQKRQCFINGMQELTISKNVALEWLSNEVKIIYDLESKQKYFYQLDSTRQAVIVDLIYNLGLNGWRSFKKTIALLEKQDFENASAELLKSKWASQVGNRAKRNSEILRLGAIQ